MWCYSCVSASTNTGINRQNQITHTHTLDQRKKRNNKKQKPIRYHFHVNAISNHLCDDSSGALETISFEIKLL